MLQQLPHEYNMDNRVKGITIQLAVPKLSQSAPYVVGIISLFSPHDTMTYRLMYGEQYPHV